MISLKKAPLSLAAAALALSLSTSNAAFAQGKETHDTSSVDEKVQLEAEDQTTEKRKQVLKEATGVIRETQNALRSLDEENTEEALAALERAAGKLTIILAREPDLALAPAGVSTVTYDVLASIDAIRQVKEEAEEALADDQLQKARRLIEDLASETVISVTNIPLATYPEAIRMAAGMIDDGELGSARNLLQTALNTLVVTDTIIPLPIAAAQQLMNDAQDLAGKEERSDEETAQLKRQIADARRELKFAEALGYAAEDEFASLHERLDSLEKRVGEGGSGEGLFAPIRKLLDDTLQSSQPETG